MRTYLCSSTRLPDYMFSRNSTSIGGLIILNVNYENTVIYPLSLLYPSSRRLHVFCYWLPNRCSFLILWYLRKGSSRNTSDHLPPPFFLPFYKVSSLKRKKKNKNQHVCSPLPPKCRLTNIKAFQKSTQTLWSPQVCDSEAHLHCCWCSQH